MRGLQSGWREFLGMGLDVTSHKAYVDGGTLEDAYWRSMVFDNKTMNPGDKRRTDKSIILPYVRWLRDPNSKSVDKHAERYSRTLSAGLHRVSSDHGNAYLFKTSRGYIGVSTGYPYIMAGDHLYFLDRAKVPYALRPVSTNSGNLTFEITSEYYVHGIMDGEALREPPPSDLKQWRQQELRKRIFGGDSIDATLPVGAW